MTRIIPRDLIRHLEWAPDNNPPPPPPPGGNGSSSAFSVKNVDDHYVIGPVRYHGGLVEVDLDKMLLDEGNSHTQVEWVQSLEGTGKRLLSGPLAIALYDHLLEHCDGEYKAVIREIQRKVRKDYADDWMMTGTRVCYSPTGLDSVTHEYGTPDAYPVSAVVVGPDADVTPECGVDDGIEALVGMRNIPRLRKISSWASAKKPYLWRVNSTPSRDDERALVLGVNGNGDGFSIGADDDINVSWPARGVAVRKIFSP